MAEACIGGRRERRSYAMGRAIGPPEHLGETTAVGTAVRIRPSRAVFARDLSIDVVAERLRELSFMLPGCSLVLNGTRLVGDTLRDLCTTVADGPLVAPPLHVRLLVRDVLVDVAIGWRPVVSPPTITSWVSTFRTHLHGTHVSGVFAGMRRGALKTDLRALTRAHGPGHFRDRVSAGLVAVVHAGLYAPRFGDPTKDRLVNPEAQRAVSDALAMAFPAYLTQYPLVRRHLAFLLG